MYGQNIYEQGGRYFWIHNTGPIGCLPYVIDRLPIKASQVDKVGCANPFNDLARYFNRKLKEVVVLLRKELPHAALTYVDVYSVKYELISHARMHGMFVFTNWFFFIAWFCHILTSFIFDVSVNSYYSASNNLNSIQITPLKLDRNNVLSDYFTCDFNFRLTIATNIVALDLVHCCSWPSSY